MIDSEQLKEIGAKYEDKAYGVYDKRKPPRKLETTPKGIEMAQKRAIACEMRKEGCSWAEIAMVFECSIPTVRIYVKQALAELIELTKEDVEDIRELELNRLDAMWKGIAEDAVSGDLDAIDRGLKIQERRSKYLGLDAAGKLEVTGKDGESLVDPREYLNSKLSQLSERKREDEDLERGPDGPDSGVAE